MPKKVYPKAVTTRLPTPPTHTRWKDHKAYWSQCERCGLCEHRKNAVLGRGQLPADIVMIGEAPGDSENLLGRPMVGPSGDLLLGPKGIWETALAMTHLQNHPPRLAITKLVACFPKETREGKDSRLRSPTQQEIRACNPRLQEFVRLTKANLLITVGVGASKHAPKLRDDWTDIIHLDHPVMLLRSAPGMYRIGFERSVYRIGDFLVKHLGGRY